MQSIFHGRRIAERVHDSMSTDQAAVRLAPRLPSDEPLPKRVPGGNVFTEGGLAARRAFLDANGHGSLEALDGPAGPRPKPCMATSRI